MNKKTIVVSLGGSILISDKGIDIKFIKKFRKFILDKVDSGFSFVIIVGGGKIARDYIKDANRIVKTGEDNSDWIGIAATRLNAQFLQVIFNDQVDKKIIIDPTKTIKSSKKIIIGAGYKPGRSTDYDAVLIAKNHKIDSVINLSNITHVYNKNPQKYKDAVKIENISWKEFNNLFNDEWKPGLNSPFDPVASKLATNSEIKVAIMDGRNLVNLDKYLKGKKFKGTIIS